jgi:hypothetical protein
MISFNWKSLWRYVLEPSGCLAMATGWGFEEAAPIEELAGDSAEAPAFFLRGPWGVWLSNAT